MPERVALGLIPGTGWRAAEIREVARAAEDAGFEAAFCTEVNNNALVTAQSMGEATRRIKVGHLGSKYLFAASLSMREVCRFRTDATDGRFVLGLGVSHQPVNRAVGIEMSEPHEALRKYTIEIASWLRGEGPATHLPQQPSPSRCRSIWRR
jgi:alkanesulfonate monooxygenase SsuD/methylene tetrahydromethanopterin reductase-like flavin-dependent oxidoreductase (luciferase family)